MYWTTSKSMLVFLTQANPFQARLPFLLYLQVLHRLYMPYVGDELHRSGWNSCSSCYRDPSKRREFMILPGLNSSRIYIVNTYSDARAPRIHKVRIW